MDVRAIIEKHNRASCMTKIYLDVNNDKINTSGDYNFLDVVTWCEDRWGIDGNDKPWKWDYEYNSRDGIERLIIIAHQDEIDLTEFKFIWL